MLNSTRDNVDKKQIYFDIADKLNLSAVLVQKICELQFKEASSIIYKEEDKVIKLPYIGKIYKKSNDY